MKKTERELSLSFLPLPYVGEEHFETVEITALREWGNGIVEEIADAILYGRNVEELAGERPTYASSLREVARILRDHELALDHGVRQITKDNGDHCLTFVVKKEEEKQTRLPVFQDAFALLKLGK